MKLMVALRRTWFRLMGHGDVASHFDLQPVEEARILAQVNGSRAIEQRGIINLTVQYFIVYTALAVPGKW